MFYMWNIFLYLFFSAEVEFVGYSTWKNRVTRTYENLNTH